MRQLSCKTPELRLLEIEVLKEIQLDMQKERDTQMRLLGADELSKVEVDQFFGIEIGEFPAKIAETALWMMDHIMNNRLSLEFGQVFARIPLTKSPHIICEDALDTNWNDLLPSADCSYVFGNPPFVGAKFQTTKQREQVRGIANLGGSGGTLDYVCAWFIKAAEYSVPNLTPVGFVSTNSITQGEQVAQLWPLLFSRRLEILFAHRTFAWGSDARGKAQVHVVVLGLGSNENAPKNKRLFSYATVNGDPHETSHSVITPYLFDGSSLNNPHTVVAEVGSPINGFPKLVCGSKPIDGGHYIFSTDEMVEFLAQEPNAKPYFRPFIGSREFLQGGNRFILRLAEEDPSVLRKMPLIVDRIQRVKEHRLASQSKPTQRLASTPLLYHINVVPTEPFLVVPEVSSERREFIPIAWLEPPVIPSNKVRILPNAELWQFAFLTSSMHMSWVRHISGRLKSDFQYGIGVVYNTFPLPRVSDSQLTKIEPLAQAILDVRIQFPNSSLADLYDPDVMPTTLRKAHNKLDKAIEGLYKRGGFSSDREKVEHLFAMYEKMIAPLTSSIGMNKKRRKK